MTSYITLSDNKEIANSSIFFLIHNEFLFFSSNYMVFVYISQNINTSILISKKFNVLNLHLKYL